MAKIKKVNGHILDMMMYHWDYQYGEIKMEDINEYNKEWKESNGEPLFDEEQIKHIEENLAGWHINAGHEGYHHHDGQVCEYYLTLTKDGNSFTYYEEHSLVTGWFLNGDNDGNIELHWEDPNVLSDEEKVQRLVEYFGRVCGFCDELNIYEWQDADESMQEMKQWVQENF